MSKICLALDGLSRHVALALTASLGNHCHAVKIHDLYDRYGPTVVSELKDAGAKRVWVDAKLKDTTDTVAKRVEALVDNGADIITVHASGGIPMMRAALGAALAGPADIWAITVLTSLDENEVARIHGRERSMNRVVLDLALDAREAGVHGLVCSAKEVGILAKHGNLEGLHFVVPGTRSAGTELGQQKRSGTPAQAVEDGATLLVAGSQVTKAADPLAAFRAMAEEIGMPVG